MNVWPRYKTGRYIPTDATAYTREGVDAVVYWYTTTAGKLCALAYHGTSAKSDWHYSYRTEEARKAKSDAHLDNWTTVDDDVFADVELNGRECDFSGCAPGHVQRIVGETIDREIASEWSEVGKPLMALDGSTKGQA